MKKTVSLILAALFILCAFAGCAKQSYDPADGYRVLSEALDAEKYGVGFRNGDIALGLEIQAKLDEMIADGTAAEISNKWFGADVLLKNEDFIEESEAPAGDNSLQAILEKGNLVLGLDDSFPPMGFRDDSNNIVGFDIDLATEVCKRIGVKLVLQPIDWDAKEMELSTGNIDCIWNGMTINDERVANMYFTKAYIANEQIVIVPTKSQIKKIDGLKGKIVGLQKGSSSLEALSKHDVFDEVKSITEFADNVTAFLDLKANRVDAFVVDSVAGRYIMANN